MNNLVFRLGQETDLPGISEICEGVYGGHDYLPGTYLKFINDPNRTVLVAEKDGKIVGLRAMLIADEGETAIAHGLRVHKHYRGQGIGKSLILASHEYIKEHFPRVKVVRQTVSSLSVEHVAMLKKSTTDVFCTKFYYLACYVDPSEMVSVLSHFSSCRCDPLTKLDKNRLGRLIEHGNIGNILFENNFFVVKCHPFKAVTSNVTSGVMISNQDYILATFLEGTVKSLSISRRSENVKCLWKYVTIFTLDETLFRAHIIKQLENAVSDDPDQIFVFCCLMDVTMADSASNILFNELSLRNVNEWSKFYVWLFEMALV